MMRRAPIASNYSNLLLATSVLLGGCTGPIFRQQSPEARLDMPPAPNVKLVSEYTHPYGMDYVKVEAVSLATGLAGTGSDPPPIPQRVALLGEMNRREVDNPNEVLASSNTSLVLVRGFLRPGIQEGDRYDVEVRVPSRSDTTSLRGGWVLPTRLTELAVLGEQIRAGHLLGMAEGAILVDPSADLDEDGALSTRGRILGGGIAVKTRPLGLVINHEHQSIRISQQMSKSISHRFHTYKSSRKVGVATPKTDEFIDLVIHPRYKDNVTRYMRVVSNVAVEETPRELQDRLLLLAHQLADPLTAASASIRLEAIGDEEAVAILTRNIESPDPEVRFYSAEALAYLDETAGVEPLAHAARHEPAFRVNALAALSAMDDAMAYDALRELLVVSSAETRYGAFRALHAMNEEDPLVRGENLGEQFSYHQLDLDGPPMIHVTHSYRPEVVLFGKGQHFKLPLVLDAGKNTLVNGLSGAKITISHFGVGEEPEQRVVSTSVDEVIRAIVELGGKYPDVVQALQQAKQDGALESRFRVDALPETGRSFDRDAPLEVATPRPNLFRHKK